MDSAYWREKINGSSQAFHDYLRFEILGEKAYETLIRISENGSTYLLSGVIRDYFLKREGKIRDVDFVLHRPGIRYRYIYEELTKESSITIHRNSFKGIKISGKDIPDVDGWLLENTWGIVEENAKPTINALLDSVFFNFSAIAFDIKNSKFIYTDSFIDFLISRHLDIVYPKNPNIPLCLFNVFYYSSVFQLSIGNRLREWIKTHYSDKIDFYKVQSKHNGYIKYSSTKIHNFFKKLLHMKFGIKWDKYLCKDRLRESEIKRDIHDAKTVDKRSPFESDFGRVVFSSPIRRMHDKTQVIPLTSGDNIHTRLTHSLEVMNTAKSLAINLCRDQDFIEEYGRERSMALERDISSILMTAGLVHDIGNPPFGHFGETVIKDFFKNYLANSVIKEEYRADFSEFDGNAQGLRVLTKLTYVGDLYGLNLTKASLAAYMKYPNPGGISKDYIGTKKHGVFYSELDHFNAIVDSCNMREGDKIKRHPLSFLVEAADSISYLAMDIEDGYNLKWYDRNTLIDYLDAEISRLMREKEKKENKSIIDRKYKHTKGENYSFLKIIDSNLLGRNWNEMNDADWIVRFRVSVIQYLVEVATINFKRNAEKIEEGIYSEELIEDQDLMVTKTLQNFTRRFILSQKDIQKAELTGYKVISGLLDILIHYVCHSDESFREKVKNVLSKSALRVRLHEENHYKKGYHYFGVDELFNADVINLSEYGKLRLVVDFISGMTDKFAVMLYQELIGIKI